MSFLDAWNDTFRTLPVAPAVVGAMAIPYVITYLSFDPSTKWLRIGLWPVSLLCWATALGRLDESRE